MANHGRKKTSRERKSRIRVLIRKLRQVEPDWFVSINGYNPSVAYGPVYLLRCNWQKVVNNNKNPFK